MKNFHHLRFRSGHNRTDPLIKQTIKRTRIFPASPLISDNQTVRLLIFRKNPLKCFLSASEHIHIMNLRFDFCISEHSDSAMPQRQQMLQKKPHPLLLVGINGKNSLQMPRSRIHTDQRHLILFSPEPFHPLIADQRNCSGRIIFFDQIKAVSRDQHRPAAGRTNRRFQIKSHLHVIIGKRHARNNHGDRSSVPNTAEFLCTCQNRPARPLRNPLDAVQSS